MNFKEIEPQQSFVKLFWVTQDFEHNQIRSTALLPRTSAYLLKFDILLLLVCESRFQEIPHFAKHFLNMYYIRQYAVTLR